MPPKRRWAIAAIVLAVVIVGTAGSYVLMNRSTGQQTSTSVIQTSMTAAQSTSLGTQYVDLSSTGTVDSYLTLLKANGNSPYVDLARELQKLPDSTNATAVAQVTMLALKAANPETKEAFSLMMKGGTANPSDFTYSIPQYNTELQVLYWLASSRHLKYDDTLALAISVSNGFWVTVGDDSVQLRVKKDAVDLLDFFRETDQLQQTSGYPRLEQLPLEAKIALNWLGGDTGTHGPHAITGPQTKHDALKQKLDLAGYDWDNVNVATLRQMRDYVKQKSWVTPSIDQTVATVDDYFYFSGFNQHFNYTTSFDVKIPVNGETVSARNINNPNFEFQYYLKNGKAIGACEDEMTIANAFLKSWGIATLSTSYYWPEGNWYNGHTSVMYYDSASGTWRIFRYHIGIPFSDVRDAYIFIPPVLQNDFIPTGAVVPKEAAVAFPFQNGELNTKMFAPMYNITGSYLNRFEKGVGTDQVKQWILYKSNPPIVPIVFASWNYQGQWHEVQVSSQGLIDSQAKPVGDLGQPYVDMSKFSYAFSDGSIFFRYDLRGTIPGQIASHVTGFWYQVFLDVDSDSNTGYHWSSDFTPDYSLTFQVQYDVSVNAVSISAFLSEHCGGSSDWCWARVGFTQRFARTSLVSGGIGQNFFVLACEYGDIKSSPGSTIRFSARTGITYDGRTYNEYAPASGTVSASLG